MMKKTLKNIGVSTLLFSTLGIGSYYEIPIHDIKGRQLKNVYTAHEYKTAKDKIKEQIETDPYNLSINQQFALEDIINYECKDGILINDFKKNITVVDIEKLISGNCEL